VLFRVLPRGIVLVLGGFEVMTECDPGMMRGLFMISRFVMLGGLAMMFWRPAHSVALLVRDARESCTPPF
jgi:hypothetical protein